MTTQGLIFILLILCVSVLVLSILSLWMGFQIAKLEDRTDVLENIFREENNWNRNKVSLLTSEIVNLKAANEKIITILEKLANNYTALATYTNGNTELCKTVKEQIINHNEIFKNQGDLIASCIKLIELQEDGLKDLDDKVATYLSTPRKGAIPIPKELQ